MTKNSPVRICILATLLCLGCGFASAQTPAKPADPEGESIDRIIAIVNGQIILQSDLDEEIRFAKLQPYRLGTGKTLREQAMSRLIDRTLILQQQQGMGLAAITDAEVDAAIVDLRKDLPACAHASCETDEGWTKFLAGVGFTPEEVRDRWRIRLAVLRFIEQRFRAGIRISEAQVEEFYKNTMLPQYAQQKVQPPPLETISARIEQVLLEQQVSLLLDQWLKTLREQGSVRILKDGEDAQ